MRTGRRTGGSSMAMRCPSDIGGKFCPKIQGVRTTRTNRDVPPRMDFIGDPFRPPGGVELGVGHFCHRVCELHASRFLVDHLQGNRNWLEVGVIARDDQPESCVVEHMERPLFQGIEIRKTSIRYLTTLRAGGWVRARQSFMEGPQDVARDGLRARPEYDGTTLPPKRKLPEARPFLADSRRLANAWHEPRCLGLADGRSGLNSNTRELSAALLDNQFGRVFQTQLCTIDYQVVEMWITYVVVEITFDQVVASLVCIANVPPSFRVRTFMHFADVLNAHRQRSHEINCNPSRPR